jgi:hypothetical protein
MPTSQEPQNQGKEAMGVFADLIGVPGLVCVGLLVCGLWLAIRPRRLLTVLGDGFGFDWPMASRGRVTNLLPRIAGAALIAYGVYLGASTLHLAEAIESFQPAPQKVINCSPHSGQGLCSKNQPFGHTP